MTDFEGLRKELGIEGKEERRARLKALHQHERQVLRIVKNVLKDLQKQVFHDSDIRELDDGSGWCICRQIDEKTGATIEKPKYRRNRRGIVTIYDIGVQLVLNDDKEPTHVGQLECWRELTSGIPISGQPGSHPTSVLCEAHRKALVDTLKQLIYRYPPGR
jgi:hypothetical protein